ncbi:tRNA uridine-5-carboxymethylaminomethyl(34) synthesis GTPase MnmE [Erythrobacter arachoides]|uniref:tRNA modification GTPase MnmE n=1 Tax=Aurantiacibacter arachoides TaxID=1850444 RepID=A0A845A411_9SPHN|nr:tRNA uridine-5-carboxymethylaminomethyl(34) synthesis GTPase MnmE [Aurantiacibacter arachoides]MXO94648.1 tRNA uridine-5-carboxymethylaminomethyl(34) synthesis GTPase MnmE [Aurantiacibacter arachoides]GGD61834.1 tRNA modification GTPase MnmE [Aurantiacibacter arachoides]
MDTIFALSSGAPPAGIGIIRITGPQVRTALETLAGRVPHPRQATRAVFRDGLEDPIDDGLILFFPGPKSVTGEDLAEFHCHGGRAVVSAIEIALGKIAGCRRAQPGEFTRRSFANGRIDLAEAEGLADLLSAETEIQRRSAMQMASGSLSRKVDGWRERVLGLSAQVEAVLDFDDEDDIAGLPAAFVTDLNGLYADITAALDTPSAEMLREGYRVALAGPPNAGKSTLFNALLDSDAAITSDVAGTTRDVLTQSFALGGAPFILIDMAGLRLAGSDPIEVIGIERAEREIKRADLVLWLGEEGAGPEGSWEVDAQCDRSDVVRKRDADFILSALTGAGLAELKRALIKRARHSMPAPGMTALNARQRNLLNSASSSLDAAQHEGDPLLIAENLRQSRAAFDALVGRTSTEDVLDSLFRRFCIGK